LVKTENTLELSFKELKDERTEAQSRELSHLRLFNFVRTKAQFRTNDPAQRNETRGGE